jgi:hypothetical protein
MKLQFFGTVYFKGNLGKMDVSVVYSTTLLTAVVPIIRRPIVGDSVSNESKGMQKEAVFAQFEVPLQHLAGRGNFNQDSRTPDHGVEPATCRI